MAVATPRTAPVPDAVAPPPRHPRFPLVDGMRAIAVLAVLGVHVAVAGDAVSSSAVGRILAHLNIGVTIFFVISGFLLYRPFVAQRAGGAEAPRSADYAKRRILRIYPAYWAALTALIILPGLTGVVDGSWWPTYALVHTLPVSESGRCVDAPFECGLAHTWSLVVEVTFYAVLPLYAFVVGTLTRGVTLRSWVALELLLLAGLSAGSVLLQFVILDPVPEWFAASVLAYVLWFALGMGMAVLSVGLGGGKHRLATALRARSELPWLAALGGYALVCIWLPPDPFLLDEQDQLVAHVAFPLIAALLLVPAVYGDRSGGLPRRLLAQPVMAWLGLISYGIFLWHYVVTIELGSQGADHPFVVVLLSTVAISIPVAALSYYIVERPLLRLKYRRLRDVLKARK